MKSWSQALRRPPAGGLMLPAAAVLAVLFVYPTIEIVRFSLFDPGFTLEHFERFFETNVYLRVFLHTAWTSAIVVAGTLLLGYPAAYFLVRMPPQARPYLLFLILIPLWMSILVRTYAWMVILGREGLINSAIVGLGLSDGPLKLLFTSEAVYVAILLPIMILACYSVMAGIDQKLVDAARVLGATPRRAFLRVFFPLSLNGVAAGGVIVFMLSMGFFITPALVGGRKDMMMANLINYQVSTTLNWGFASAVAIILMASTISVALLFRRFVRVPGGQS